MEELVNINTIVDNDIYKTFKEMIICPICNNIYISPVMCLNCQKEYCKKCIENSIKNNEQNDQRCKCENPNFVASKGKQNLLSKLKFKCKDCDMEINYDDTPKHKEFCDIMKNFVVVEKPRIKKLNKKEMNKLSNEGNKINYITSKI